MPTDDSGKTVTVTSGATDEDGSLISTYEGGVPVQTAEYTLTSTTYVATTEDPMYTTTLAGQDAPPPTMQTKDVVAPVGMTKLPLGIPLTMTRDEWGGTGTEVDLSSTNFGTTGFLYTTTLAGQDAPPTTMQTKDAVAPVGMTKLPLGIPLTMTRDEWGGTGTDALPTTSAVHESTTAHHTRRPTDDFHVITGTTTLIASTEASSANVTTDETASTNIFDKRGEDSTNGISYSVYHIGRDNWGYLRTFGGYYHCCSQYGRRFIGGPNYPSASDFLDGSCADDTSPDACPVSDVLLRHQHRHHYHRRWGRRVCEHR